MTKPKPNRALYRLSRQPFWLGWRFCFCQGDNHSLVQTFVSFGAFLCGRDLGLFRDVEGFKRRQKGVYCLTT
jgi:hypothetical protein